MVKPSKVPCQACGAENYAGELSCPRCGALLPADPNNGECTVICPRCHNANNAGSFFCYSCGKYFADISEDKKGWRPNKRKRDTAQSNAPKAKVVMPGGTEILLTGIPVFIERSDFDSTLPHDLLMNISRQHILITYNKGKYFIKDYGRDGKGSTNHTRLNGTDIYRKRKQVLKDGDKIELAGQPELTVIFRLLQEPN